MGLGQACLLGWVVGCAFAGPFGSAQALAKVSQIDQKLSIDHFVTGDPACERLWDGFDWINTCDLDKLSGEDESSGEKAKPLKKEATVKGDLTVKGKGKGKGKEKAAASYVWQGLASAAEEKLAAAAGEGSELKVEDEKQRQILANGKQYAPFSRRDHALAASFPHQGRTAVGRRSRSREGKAPGAGDGTETVLCKSTDVWADSPMPWCPWSGWNEWSTPPAHSSAALNVRQGLAAKSGMISTFSALESAVENALAVYKANLSVSSPRKYAEAQKRPLSGSVRVPPYARKHKHKDGCSHRHTTRNKEPTHRRKHPRTHAPALVRTRVHASVNHRCNYQVLSSVGQAFEG